MKARGCPEQGTSRLLHAFAGNYDDDDDLPDIQGVSLSCSVPKMKLEQEATWRLYKTKKFMEQNVGLDFFLLVLKMGRVQMKKHLVSMQ